MATSHPIHGGGTDALQALITGVTDLQIASLEEVGQFRIHCRPQAFRGNVVEQLDQP